MPEGLEKDVPPQMLADVLAFLNTQGPPRKIFDGNQPAVVRPEALRGELYLLASNGEIYGNTLVYEPKYRNVGYWKSSNDHVTWSVEVPAETEYRVMLDYACAAEHAGKTFLFEVGGKRLLGKVPSTGSWDAYQQLTLGTLRLPAGKHRAGLRAADPLNGALMDLKAVNLRPVSP